MPSDCPALGRLTLGDNGRDLLGQLLSRLIDACDAVRVALAAPLVVHEEEAAGDLAYIMSGGHAFKERLRAGADLFHMGRVPVLVISATPRRSHVYFPEGRNWSETEWSVGYLKWLGVPGSSVVVLPPAGGGVLSSAAEARSLARHRPADARRVVVVTSAAHTRRSRLAMRRALPDDIEVVAFAATPFVDSAEKHRPLFLEYVKLFVYLFAA